MIDDFHLAGNAFLSNFAKVWVELGDVAFPTVEHAYVVAKARTWDEFYAQVRIPLDEYQKMTPGGAKRLGRQVRLRRDWNEARQGVMLDLLRQKFAHPHFAELLLATGDEDIVEGNWWHDQYWGSCNCHKHKDVQGSNVLGRMLMTVRDELRWNIVATWLYPTAARVLAASHDREYHAGDATASIVIDHRSPYGQVPHYKVVCTCEEE